jgi:hypothetical protein
MQNRIYHCLFFISLLLLPIGSAAKIDTQNTPPEAVLPAVFAKKQGSFSTKNLFERFRLFNKVKSALNMSEHIDSQRLFQNGTPNVEFQNPKSEFRNRYTEGGDKKAVTPKNTLAKRIFTILLFAAIGVLIVYYLQGTIWLALVGGGLFAYWRNRNRLTDWERRRYERINAPDMPSNKGTNKERNQDVVSQPSDIGKSKSSLSHSANKLTRRALIRFFVGLGLAIIGLVAVLINSFSSSGSITLSIIVFLVGYILAILGYVNAIQALVAKEPQSALAWLVIIFGLPVVFFLFGGLIS